MTIVYLDTLRVINYFQFGKAISERKTKKPSEVSSWEIKKKNKKRESVVYC